MANFDRYNDAGGGYYSIGDVNYDDDDDGVGTQPLAAAGSTTGNSAAYGLDDNMDDNNDPSFFGHFENPDPRGYISKGYERRLDFTLLWSVNDV